MNKQEKAHEIEQLEKALRGGPAAFVLTAQGLSVNKTSELRKKIGATSSRYRVVKNRLALRALKDTPLAALAPHFRGPTALAFGLGDAAPLARAIGEFARQNQGLRIKAGMVDGRMIGPVEAQLLADMPPRPIMIARLAGLLNAPMTRLVRVLKEPARGLVRAMNEIARQKESADHDAAASPS